MAHPATGVPRVFRAAVLGAVAFALALSAHVAAGGPAPSPAFACVLALVCIVMCLALTSRRLGPAAITTTLGVFQVGSHYSFLWLTSGRCVLGSPNAMAPMQTHGGAAQALNCVPTAAGEMSSISQASTAWMMGAHAVATLGTALVLARGERVLWLMGSAVWSVFQVVGRVRILTATRRSESPLTLGVGRALLALGGIGRRGPPAPMRHF